MCTRMASVDAHSVAVLVSNYHDSGSRGPALRSTLRLQACRGGRMLVQHFRVDDQHSNSYEAWKAMGSPAQPDARQRAALESAGQLQALESPRWVQSDDGTVRLRFELPLHGVSLIRVDW